MATLKTKILHRNDTTQNWTTANPTLSKGEFGIEWTVASATGTEGACKVKVGDGFTAWNDLNYFGGDAIKITTSGSGNSVISVTSSTDSLGVVTYTLSLGDRLTGSSLTANQVLLGNGGVAVKSSGKTIVTTVNGSDNIPTDKAVKTYVDGKIAGVTAGAIGAVTSVAVGDDDVVNLSVTKSGTTVTVTGSHAKKGPSAGYTSGNATTSISGSGATGTIKVPQITVDAYGHVTAAADEDVVITMPTIPSVTAGITGTGNVITAISASGHAITATKGISVYTKDEVDKKIGDSGVKSVSVGDDNVVNLSVTMSAGAVTITGVHATGGANTSKGATADVSVAIGATGSIKVPYATVNTYGHTTALKEQTLTIDLSNTYTKEEIDKKVSGAVDYLGTVASASALAALKPGYGDFVRVSTDFDNYHAGDLLVNNSETATPDWVLIHGEEVGVESVTQGSGIAITGTAANPIVSHSDTSSVENLTKKSRTYVSSLTFDEFGHVTAYGTDTETVEDTTYGADRGISLVNGNFGHSNTAVNAVSTSQLLKVKYDQYGHITGSTPVEAKDITDLGIVGTDTTYAAGTGLELKDGTFNHKNSVAAVTSAGLLKVAYDAQGHIIGSSAVTKEDIANTGVDINNTWRKIQLEGNDILGSATTTNPFNIKAGTNMTISNSNGTVTFNAASYTASKGIKLVDKDFQLNITTLDGGSAADSGWGTVS